MNEMVRIQPEIVLPLDRISSLKKIGHLILTEDSPVL